MKSHRTTSLEEFKGIIEEKVTALIREMEEANWNGYEVALAIEAFLKKSWLAEEQALRAARESVPKNFVSDGNEG